MPLEFSERQRKQLSTRLMLQAPASLTLAQRQAVQRDLDSRVMGLPAGAFMALDALRLLADQGNKFAGWLFEQQSEELGLTERFYSFGK